jgi:sterol desaturase/sphingolipid hydroxylase (fatty acid hydroxylase superfamily)
MSVDLTLVAIPAYFGTMAGERRLLRTRSRGAEPGPADYEQRDTLASLAMGLGSVVVPLVAGRALAPLTPGRGRYGRALVTAALGAAAATTAADVLARHGGPRLRRAARRVARTGGVVAVVAGGLALTTTWAAVSSAENLWRRTVLKDRGPGPGPALAAVLAWDFVYYWNHRFAHESRFLWAIHSIHHSSERYNLSTALRQPVGDALGVSVPYGLICLFGVRPEHVVRARAINLLYQYWIHTDAIRRMGPPEAVLNTPSHHRVHHGSNRRYLDRNHGSILIVWDRIFGTFQREDEPVTYGLTTNIDTFHPWRIAAHEHVRMFRDVADSTTWRERLSYVLRAPGWAPPVRRGQSASPGDAEVT